MDQRTLKELAEAGGLCETCGGVHTRRIEQALIALEAQMPVCDCDCAICKPLREAIQRLMENDPDIRSPGHDIERFMDWSPETLIISPPPPEVEDRVAGNQTKDEERETDDHHSST